MEEHRGIFNDERMKQEFRAATWTELETMVEALLGLVVDPFDRKAVADLLRIIRNLEQLAVPLRLDGLVAVYRGVARLLESLAETEPPFDCYYIDLLLKFCDDIHQYVAEESWLERSLIRRWQKLRA